VGQPRHMREHEVYDMVQERLGKEEITDACAVSIAAWWQSPRGNGYALAQLASTGTVDYSDLSDAIMLTRREAVESYGSASPDVAALDMLGTWALHRQQS